MEAGRVKEVRKDIAKLEEGETDSSELHLFKGLVKMSENNKKGALLSF